MLLIEEYFFFQDRLLERVMSISGPTHELPPQDCTEKKFNGRNRLYIGNLTNDVTEEEMKEMFAPHGEVSEIFINKEKNFAFLKMVIILNNSSLLIKTDLIFFSQNSI